MSTRFLPLASLFLFFSLTTFSQGWQSLGPDSTNWQNVRRVSGKWLSATSYKIAAATDNGIAHFGGNQWSYPLVNIPSGPMNIGRTFVYFDFSPWEDDSIYYAFADHYTEPSFHLVKSPLARWPYRSIGYGGCWMTPIGMIFSQTDSTAFATVCGAHRSTNYGVSWNILEFSTSLYGSKILSFNKQSSRVLYRASSTFTTTTLFVSTNAGVSWDSLRSVQAAYPDYTGESPLSTFATGDTIIVGVKSPSYDTSPDMGIFRSTNNGVSWTKTYANKRVVGIAESYVSPNTLFAASEAGIIKSTDWGATWFAYNNGLPTTRLTSLLLSPYSDTMFVSTETHGVLKVWNFLTDVNEETKFPLAFELRQNYPNPFNPSTTISFQLSAVSHVTLKVYDLLGREVATLVNELKQPGTHQVQFNASNLSSGVYLYQLKAGGFVQTKKLILLN